MATYRVLGWKGIPSMVEAADGTDTAKRALSERFQLLIDAVAMRLGLAGTDEYLEQWGYDDAGERPGRAAEVVDAVVAEIEARYAEYRDRGPGEE